MSKFNVHAGHNSFTPGASGFFPETEENRVIKDKVIKLLVNEGHTVYDCTDEDGKTSSQNLVNIVTKCNSNEVDLDISIHFNCFHTGTAHGVEVYQYSDKTLEIATRICENISKLGFYNRGVKDGTHLYVLKKTNARAILIECCFCNNAEDFNLYNADTMAKAIAEGILGKEIATEWYRVRTSWEDAKSQLAAYRDLENAKNNCPAGYFVFDSKGNAIYPEVTTGMPDISPLKGLDKETFIAFIGSLAKEDMKKTGVLASVTVAQAILESNWGQSELSVKANNLFGMKATLSGNKWDSEWDGQTYKKYSNEEYNGETKPVLSEFRYYSTLMKSIKDHSDYLCGALNGDKLRYDGLKWEKDYVKAIQIIKDGGYATDSNYVNKIVSIIEEHNLDVFDFAVSPSDLENIRNEIESIQDTLEEAVSEVQDKLEAVSEFVDKFDK